MIVPSVNYAMTIARTVYWQEESENGSSRFEMQMPWFTSSPKKECTNLGASFYWNSEKYLLFAQVSYKILFIWISQIFLKFPKRLNIEKIETLDHSSFTKCFLKFKILGKEINLHQEKYVKTRKIKSQASEPN